MAITTGVDQWVEQNSDRLIDDLKQLCSFESISNLGEPALQSCRDWLGRRLARLTDRVEVLSAGGLPALYAEVPGAGSRRLLLYQHYDVQPVDPLNLWTSPPFEPAERDGRLFARGVCDDKSDVMARIHAVEALQANGGLPVTLRFLVEGEEEIGSRSFPDLVARNSARLVADGCLWESAGFNAAGRAQVMFGVRGLLYVQLVVRTLAYDQHSGWASLLPSAAAYLVAALASLRDFDMNVKIDGFYDHIVGPSEEDRRLMAAIDPDVDAWRAELEFDRPLRDVAPEWAVEQLLFMPTLNFAGITTGYQGPGSKTVLPAEASAKLDFRLIPDQDPEDVLAKLRLHLDAHGFEKVEVAWWTGEKPARSDVNSEIGKAVIDVARSLHGEPEIWPFMPATGPFHPVVHDLGVPVVMAPGAARPDARIHSPDENIHVRDYLDSVRLLARVFERFGSG